ncbi:MAG: NAD-dependent epimerase/dehydratase family protein [bacterium]|jgi:nucleoside-diphosphate-sugar epimerase
MGTGKKQLVLGGTGQLGLSLLRYLLSVGRGARTIVRNPDKLYEAGLHEEIEVLTAEMDDVWTLRKIIEGSSAVYYCSTKWITEPQDALIEMIWAERIANACLEFDVRLVVPSCAWVYGRTTVNPIPETHPLLSSAPYGTAKAAVEHVVMKLARASGLPATVLRLPALWGPFARCPVSINPLRAVARGRGFPLPGDGETKVEWLDPRDAARALHSCTENDRTIGQVYNVPGSGEILWREFGAWVAKVAGIGPKIRRIPSGFAGRLLGQSGFEQTLSWWYSNPLILDGSEFRRDTGFVHTYQLRQSIADAWQWYSNRRPEDVYGIA